MADFRRIVESLRAAVAVADSRGDISFANAAFVQLVGRGEENLAGTTMTLLFPEADRKRLQQNLSRVAEGKVATAFVDAQVAGRWVQVALQPALDDRGKAAGVIALLTDIGTERETERALNLVTARLIALAESSPAAAMIENAAGEIEVANQAFCKLLAIGSSPQSLAGMPVADAFAQSSYVDAKVLERLRARKDPRLKLQLKLPDGGGAILEREPITVDKEAGGAVWSPRSSAAGEEGARDAAEVALIEKIGMELSVAMEGISAIAIRAQQLEFDSALVDHFQRIRESTQTAMAAIGDLVDFSKVSGGVVLHKTEFGLREALGDLVSRLAPNAEEHGCRLRIKVEQDVSDRLEGDVERLLLVVKNLLDNAFVLLPGSEVTLQITPEYVTESGIQLSFGVTASADAAQPLSSTSAESGMGVAVAKFMVAAMGGQLAVSTRSPGDPLYAFTLQFPVMAPPPAPRRATYVSLVGLPVMVVSGEPEQRLQVTNLLRGWRMVPLEADNAAMAMALLERMHSEGAAIPLVILSNRLPMQDGFLLAFRIKNSGKFRATLVMMLANEGRPGDAIACRENGISAYMRYPIADRQLNEAIIAVTGASVDADETPTLVTRHSLREHRKGATVLLIDSSRDSQILAAHILGREDCSVVVAQDLEEAFAALDQDLYDIVLADTGLAGLGGEDAARLLRARIPRDAEKTALVATHLDHAPAYRKAKLAIGFDDTLGKPFRKDPLLGLLESRGHLAAEAG
ncbi:MAG TPA: response regulator [Usitatibacter sp.]|jgi:PAS domain S-box-containing protein|nr:response regulator [Usitatibacter sp.]